MKFDGGLPPTSTAPSPVPSVFVPVTSHRPLSVPLRQSPDGQAVKLSVSNAGVSGLNRGREIPMTYIWGGGGGGGGGVQASKRHAKIPRERICSILRAAMLRQRLQTTLSTSPSLSILTPGQPVLALTL